MRTPLTYYGGKQGLATQILPLMPDHRVYLEPFCGGAAVLFAKPRCDRETLNDADGRIMAFWRALRDRPDELAAAVASTAAGRDGRVTLAAPIADRLRALAARNLTCYIS